MEISGYKIDREIGQGGMATVYLALQESLQRDVVLKVMSTQLGDSPEYAKRFLNEGHMLAAVSHPNIITIYDIGIAETFLYLAMEYLEGGSLMKRLERGVTPDEGLDIVARIAGALSVAHSKGIVHRDVKPANILYRADDTPVLTDFGIAKQSGDNELTSTGTILGSPFYMSPEQIEGKLQLDGRSDIYSLGVIFYEMLTGNRPYEGDSAINIVLKHLQQPIPTLPKHFSQYQSLLNLMMAKDRDDRLPDATSLLEYISALQNPSKPESTRVFKRHEIKQAATGNRAGRSFKPGAKTQSLAAIRSVHWRYWMAAAMLVVGLSAVLAWYFISEINRYGGVSMIAQPGTAPPAQHSAAPPPPDAPVTATTQMAQFEQEVFNALKWLGRKSIEDGRLTRPPEDNAYYYFQRLLSLDPGNVQALQGIAQVAEKLADRAEDEARKGRYTQAEAALAEGLRIAPQNKRLQVLQSTIQLREKSLWDNLAELLGLND